ncbi:hypothetical protein [Streptomyces noursei]|uniref:hypothetical protein n=1 Tax=Streptomyces noursei TaxID=1971 RepID=UPI001966B880|nr:hypothetical protein [Streptomyces noursei]QRX96351.1 hypothetical protein JNO44_41130 [Streptomyces noursei]
MTSRAGNPSAQLTGGQAEASLISPSALGAQWNPAAGGGTGRQGALLRPSGNKAIARVVRTSLPKAGDDRFGVRMSMVTTVQGLKATLALEAAAARIGPNAISVTNGGLGGAGHADTRQAIQSRRATPPEILGLGVALSAANAKNAPLTLAAGASISAAGIPVPQQAGTLAVFVLVASVGVLAS